MTAPWAEEEARELARGIIDKWARYIEPKEYYANIEEAIAAERVLGGGCRPSEVRMKPPKRRAREVWLHRNDLGYWGQCVDRIHAKCSCVIRVCRCWPEKFRPRLLFREVLRRPKKARKP